jgi:hypothetical protein
MGEKLLANAIKKLQNDAELIGVHELRVKKQQPDCLNDFASAMCEDGATCGLVERCKVQFLNSVGKLSFQQSASA